MNQDYIEAAGFAVYCVQGPTNIQKIKRRRELWLRGHACIMVIGTQQVRVLAVLKKTAVFVGISEEETRH